MNVRLTRTANTRTYSRPGEDERGEKVSHNKRRSAVNLFDLATEALDLLRQDALRKSTAMPQSLGRRVAEIAERNLCFGRGHKGKGPGPGRGIWHRRRAAAKARQWCRAGRSPRICATRGCPVLSNTVLSNEEILLEIEEMSLDSKMSVSPNSRS